MLLSIPYILVLCLLVIPTETIPKQEIFARKFEGKFGKSKFSLGILELIISECEFSLEISERIIVQSEFSLKISERIFRSKRIFAWKFASTTTIGIAKIRRIFCELSCWTKIRHFSSKSPEIREFRRITFSLLFHNTVAADSKQKVVGKHVFAPPVCHGSWSIWGLCEWWGRIWMCQEIYCH